MWPALGHPIPRKNVAKAAAELTSTNSSSHLMMSPTATLSVDSNSYKISLDISIKT